MIEFDRRGDRAGLGRMAHALAGASGSVGAVEVRDLCRRLEAWCLRPVSDKERPCLEELEGAFGAASAMLVAAAGDESSPLVWSGSPCGGVPAGTSSGAFRQGA
jgi:HPt (histidine-containing phosphotransfer) domain-containing protein